MRGVTYELVKPSTFRVSFFQAGITQYLPIAKETLMRGITDEKARISRRNGGFRRSINFFMVIRAVTARTLPWSRIYTN